MKTTFLDNANPEAVSHAVRDVVERHDGLISSHRHSSLTFRMPGSAQQWSWTRRGYIGIYQHLGETEVMVRLSLRAMWPHRILWTVATLNLILTILTILTNPPPTAWFATALLGGTALLLATLTYIATIRPVRHEERDFMDQLQTQLAQHHESPPETEQQRDERQRQQQLEGELTQRRLQPTKTKRFTITPTSSPDKTDQRRRQLLARKQELETRRKQN